MGSLGEEMTSRALQTKIVDMRNVQLPLKDDAETDPSQRWLQGDLPAEIRQLIHAASILRESNIPIAFPTETVYGLGADATRSAAVRGIYKAKNRPSDNPLIVHFGHLAQLRRLLKPDHVLADRTNNRIAASADPIPPVYLPLIRKFWPGPLTILLPLPSPNTLAPEVSGSSSLKTFGARMPSSPLARLLISLADRPLAAPSANLSTRPSPTRAQHVYEDMKGRIELILDGGPCNVGVESTVVDGLSSPPAILRPGGIGIDEIRSLGGFWSNVVIGYHDHKKEKKDQNDVLNGANSHKNMEDEGPRAPGMKYRHYAPRGKVFLFEADVREDVILQKLHEQMTDQNAARFGIIRTRLWSRVEGSRDAFETKQVLEQQRNGARNGTEDAVIFDQFTGPSIPDIARGLFSALRTMDELQCDVIFIEGISDTEGDLAAAVMNRLRKAAEVDVR